MNDLFGQSSENAKDPTPARRTDRGEKLMRLCGLMQRIPPLMTNGASLSQVRQWKLDREKAQKTFQSGKSTINDLTMAIASLERWLRPDGEQISLPVSTATSPNTNGE